MFEKLLHILNFTSPLSKQELNKDLVEDGFTAIVKDNGNDRNVTAVAYKINKDVN
jgi:hypothetical protein